MRPAVSKSWVKYVYGNPKQVPEEDSGKVRPNELNLSPDKAEVLLSITKSLGLRGQPNLDGVAEEQVCSFRVWLHSGCKP